MFTKKKSFYQKKPFYIVLAAIIAFGIFVNQIPEKASGDNVKANVEKQTDAGRPATDEKTDAFFDERAAEAAQTYYLVKEINGIIKVFYRDARGGETELQNTNISFSLISESDQRMFSNGVVVRTDEELQNLLQDFES